MVARKIGSQYRETLKESGYYLVARPEPKIVVLGYHDPYHDREVQEVWVADDHHAGYTIQVGRWGYEFVCTLKPEEHYPR